MTLSQKQCIPCRKGDAALSIADAQARLKELSGWALSADGKWLEKQYKFKNFAGALAFTNRIGEIAEAENHHPDLTLGWGYVRIRLQTHDVGGLHENDFIIAAKIQEIQHIA